MGTNLPVAESSSVGTARDSRTATGAVNGASSGVAVNNQSKTRFLFNIQDSIVQVNLNRIYSKN